MHINAIQYILPDLIKSAQMGLYWLNRVRSSYVNYTGYRCGCCGRWIAMRFSVSKRYSLGEWADTIGLCPKCSFEADSENENLLTSFKPGI